MRPAAYRPIRVSSRIGEPFLLLDKAAVLIRMSRHTLMSAIARTSVGALSIVLTAAICCFAIGCAPSYPPGSFSAATAPGYVNPPIQATYAYENPLPLAGDPGFLWDQVVDVVDDYFPIAREQRADLLGDVVTEGRLDTAPVTGATLLEPWRGDSVGVAERLESTLQQTRRFAVVRLIPGETGLMLDVAVFKELEDLRRPEHSTAGAATFRYDSALQRFRDPVGAEPLTQGWIPRGRDSALEQRILSQIQARTGRPPGIYQLPPRNPGY